MENGQSDSPAVERELDSLWSDILAITVTAHNMSGQHDAVNLRDLEFLKQVIEKLYRESTDDLLDSRLKKNLSVIKEQMETLEEQERVEPQFSRLTALVEKLANRNSPNNEFVEARLSEFESIYKEIVNSGKLKYETLADAVTMTAGIFNKLAVTISNDAQESVNRAALRIEFTPQNQRFSLLAELYGAINSAISDLEFSKKVLGRLKNMQINPTLRSTINQNYSGVSSTISSLNQMENQLTSGLTQSSSGGGGGGCYVATAVYGSYDCPPVWTLRRFRDYDLAKSIHGRAFIHVYYAVSPCLVRVFGNTNWFRALCKKPLDRLVAKCKAKGYSDLPYKDQIWS